MNLQDESKITRLIQEDWLKQYGTYSDKQVPLRMKQGSQSTSLLLRTILDTCTRACERKYITVLR